MVLVVEGAWAGWSDWSSSCAGGLVTRTRACGGSTDCLGPATETGACGKRTLLYYGSEPLTDNIKLYDMLGQGIKKVACGKGTLLWF